MTTRWPAPHFRGLEKRDDAWDLVVKVKYNGTLKRFNAHVNGSHFDHNLAALRSKVASAFKFSSDVEFILTYTDEDGDMVMLDDENDLHDAAINQKLSPLRIDVQLKSSSTKSPKVKHQASNSRSPRSTALEDQLAQVKSAIDEAMKFVPEQVPAVLAKLSHDFRSRAASTVPSLAELLDRLATLMTSKGNAKTFIGPVHGPSCSSSGGPLASRNDKLEHENELMTGSPSQPPDMHNTPGLKSVLPEDPKAQVEQAPVHHSVDSLNFASLGRKKSDCKGSTVTETKVRCASQSKGKSTTSSAVPPVSSCTYAATPIQSPAMGEKKLKYWPTYGYQSFSGGLQSRGVPPVAPPYHRHLRSSGNINRDWQPSFATYRRLLGSSGDMNRDWQPSFAPPPTNMCGLPKLDMPSSVGTYVSSKDGLDSVGSSYKYDVPSSVSNNLEGRYSFGRSYNYGSIPQLAVHKWIQCDGCGVTPIVGSRYKSNVKGDYDLCGACFSHMGNESEYTRLDKSAPINNQKLLGRLPQGALKLECSFISDVTIPDGTSMAPSNLFTKIWRLRNSGSAVWPLGTQVIWVGGDQFAVQNSVKLGVSVNGVAGGQEVDVTVDFLAPAKPGRYISYWRLALPSGLQFGQRIWVHIQVEEPIQTSGNKLSAAINLNIPPLANSTALKPSIDTNNGSMDPFFQYPLNIYNEMPPCYHDSSIHLESESEPDSPTAPNFQCLNCTEVFPRFQKPVILKESVPASSRLPHIPITDHHASSAGPALTVMSSVVPAPETETIPVSKPVSFYSPAPETETITLPKSVIFSSPAPETETIPLPKSVSFAAPVSASSVPAPASLPGDATTSVLTAVLPVETVNCNEEQLLRELEELGFGEVDLNKEILRRNKYDLEESVRELCGLDDWDPLVGELSELGFNDAEMNNEAVTGGGRGSVKRMVMNLVTRAKKDR